MTQEEFDKLPRDKRWSFSRLQTFANCPRKHHYSYVEEIRGDGNIHTQLGDIFHQLMDARNKKLDPEPILKNYEDLVRAGKIDKPVELMRHVYNEYDSWYAVDKVLYSEESLFEEWEDKDWATFRVDCVYQVEDLNILRDTKTTTSNKSKYDFGSVKYNPQLLLYKPVVEAAFGIKIHGIEIDEVRLDICQPVPFNKTGKPTADIRRLGLVKYDVYYNTLCEMGLDTEPEYQSVLNELEKRGHPLFTRITVDVDDHVVDENLQDIYGIYKMAKTGCKSRKRSILCDYCDLRMLCEAEYNYLDEAGKQIIVDKITKSS